jgi:hypothetical protein
MNDFTALIRNDSKKVGQADVPAGPVK